MESTPEITPETLETQNQNIGSFINNFKQKMRDRFGRKSILPGEQKTYTEEPKEEQELGQKEKLALFARVNKLVQDGRLEGVSEVQIGVTKDGGVDALAIAELINAQEAVWLHELNTGDVLWWTGPDGQSYYYLVEEKYQDRRKDMFAKKGKGALQTNETDETGEPIQRVFSNARIYGSNIGSMQAMGRIVKNCGIEIGVLNPERTEQSKQEYKRRKSLGEKLVPESQAQHNHYDVGETPPVESFGIIRAEKLQELAT